MLTRALPVPSFVSLHCLAEHRCHLQGHSWVPTGSHPGEGSRRRAHTRGPRASAQAQARLPPLPPGRRACTAAPTCSQGWEPPLKRPWEGARALSAECERTSDLVSALQSPLETRSEAATGRVLPAPSHGLSPSCRQEGMQRGTPWGLTDTGVSSPFYSPFSSQPPQPLFPASARHGVRLRPCPVCPRQGDDYESTKEKAGMFW